MSTLADAAIKLASQGNPVFPCIPDGKRPACANGYLDATTDLGIVRGWWRENPNYNIGLAVGMRGIAVVDLDGAEGRDNWNTLAAENGAPDTYLVETPSGGHHLYYRGKLTNSASKLAAHIDTRGEGGYVLAPPSTFEGRPYLVAQAVPLAELPAWVAERIATSAPVARVAADVDLDTPAALSRAATRLRQLIACGDVAVEAAGGGRYRTIQLCCEMLELGISAERMFEVIAPWNAACIPPWEREEFEGAPLARAVKYMQNAPASSAVPAASEAFPDAAKLLPAAPPRKSRFLTVAQMNLLPPPEWLVPGWLALGQTSLMVGGWGTYKSFIALDLALAVATGQPVWGIKPSKPGLVVYGALEGLHGIAQARRRAWCLAHGMDADADLPGFRVGLAPRLNSPEDCEAYMQDLRVEADDCGLPLVLVINDTVSQSMAGLDEVKDAGTYIQFMKDLAGHSGAHVLSIHHSGHDKTRGARGGTIYPANMDTFIEVEALGKLSAKVTVEKQKDAPEPPPVFLMGATVGPSLVFTPRPRAEVVAEQQDEEPHAPTTVGAALVALKAIGAARSVTTAVLCQMIHPRHPGEDPEHYAQRIAFQSGKLRSAGRKKLRPYTADGQWFMPEEQAAPQ